MSGGQPDSKILVLGAKGQVGRALTALIATGEYASLGTECVAWDREELNVEDLPALDRALGELKPTLILNAAAYTAVDLAEKEEASATKVNGEVPGVLARYAARAGIPLVHYSTDYVFDGSGKTPWKEDDPTGPLSAYGRSKLEGEKQVAAAGGKYFIFRTSWVYDESGKNFLRTMLRLGSEREALAVVDDQVGAPTYAAHLAKATLDALENALAKPEFPSGIYHLCNAGETTWHGFALAIFEAAKARGVVVKVKEVKPIPSSAYPTPARRPLNSRMSMDKVKRELAIHMPHWSRGLTDCMEKVQL